jgi:transposase InsO family protein
MKDKYPSLSLSKICRLLGITRQAYYKHFWSKSISSVEEDLVIQEVLRIRKFHRRMGGRKLYEKLEPFMLEHQIKMGRDALFDLLSDNGLLVKRRKSKIYTTQSFHWLRKYSNLIKELELSGINELWVSDITYWKVADTFYYITLITDAFSHKIVGFHLAQSLEAVESLKALKMAVASLKEYPRSINGLIHHSDRGIQYCSKKYVELLQEYDIQISMCENGDPRENAIAERVNGILKEEYLLDQAVKYFEHAEDLLASSIKLYNEDRPHYSIGLLSPELVHRENIKTEKLWKSYYTVKTETTL